MESCKKCDYSEGTEIQKIEQLLRNFTSQIPELRQFDYHERLKLLKMNSEQRRLERYKIIYTWKVLEGLVPNCGLSWSTEQDRLGRRCFIPTLAAKARKLREASFQVSGPRLFNIMPKDIREMTGCSIDQFKEKLDMFLCQVPDVPRVGSYSCGPGFSNSLLSQVANRRGRWTDRGVANLPLEEDVTHIC